ncbi:MAG: T9SS type A sorting domain-containing protein [Bacteroidota bacterium]
MENFSFGDTLPSGDYAPYDDFSNLIGCPINGTWELKIEDLWWQDNGSITDWTLQFYDQNAQKDIVVGIRPENVINGRSSNMTAFEIHPNPSKGSFSLQTDLAEMAVLRIFNAQGQLLNEQIVPKGKQQIQQDYDLVDGLYYFVLQSNLQTWRKKVVIEK